MLKSDHTIEICRAVLTCCAVQGIRTFGSKNENARVWPFKWKHFSVVAFLFLCCSSGSIVWLYGWNRLNPVKQDILLCSVFSIFWTWDLMFRIWQLGIFKRYIEVSRRYMVQSLLRDLRGNVSCNLSPVLMSGNLRRSGISIPDFSDLWKDDYVDITEHREKLGRVGKITCTLLFSRFVPDNPRRSGFHKSGVTTRVTGKVDELRSLGSFGILPT